MAAALPSPPLVLGGRVDMGDLTGKLGPKWIPIKCIRQKAYGCGEHGQEIVEGLKLYVHPGDSTVRTSSMAIRVNEKALRRIDLELEIGDPGEDVLPCEELGGSGLIQIADQNLVVLILDFRRRYYPQLIYHLIYDAVDASITLYKDLLDHHRVALLKPVPVRTDDGGYELVLMVHNNIRVPGVDTGIYHLCFPGPRDVGTGPRLVNHGRLPSCVPHSFSVDVAFTFNGMAFWADLSQGAAYCDLYTSHRRGIFDFINFPECKPDPNTLPNDEPMIMARTMGCVGDSIWFVCVKRSETCAKDLVTTWTLDLTRKKWKKEVEIHAEDLWGLDSFKEARFKRKRLPKVELEYPSLTADGALCLVVPDERDISDYGPEEDIICGFDMRLKNLLWHGRVINYHRSNPVILPSNFFPMLCKRKWNDNIC